MNAGSPFRFGTKAETLERLRPHLKKSVVPSIHYFSIGDFRKDLKGVLQRVADAFGGAAVVVRSSAAGEDHADQAMAGRYRSVQGVASRDSRAVASAVESVAESYLRDRGREEAGDHILVQEMVEKVSMSGVLFTQDMNTGAPYFVINYDDESGRTDTVTSGHTYSNRTLYVHRGGLASLESERFRALIAAVEEIESVTGRDALDVEFALDSELRVHIFQVRPITTGTDWNRGLGVRIDGGIRRVRTFVRERFRPLQGVYGNRSLFGQMPDWNPAEMIGRAPRPLALSLYRNLITDRAWRQAREKMGYAVPSGMPLMVSLEGQPFIDVRLSFHSYLPADLPATIAHKLVNASLDRLAENPHLHDKVEFDVAITCMTFDFEDRMARQYPGVLSPEEASVFRERIAELTRGLLTGTRSSIGEALGRIEHLSVLRSRLLDSRERPDLPTMAGLLEDCIEYGTIPFSVLARHAFVAQSLLLSLVARGVFSAADSASFQRSIRTVAGKLAEDTRRLALGEIDRSVFMDRYGHLRPGTYNILSARYDQREDLFEAADITPGPVEGDQPSFTITSVQRSDIDRSLKQYGLGVDAEGLLQYMREATAAREQAKFVFTRNISDALEAIALWGKDRGLSREELSFVSIRDILDTLASVGGESAEGHLRALSDQARDGYEVTVGLRLPQILCSENDVSVIPLRLDQPNFITGKSARGLCVRLDEFMETRPEIRDRIVLIEKADPGFDWIFAYGIRALVTKYGGANSHMAIRCAEFGIPAAIGCGEQLFERMDNAKVIEINCAERNIHPVRE